MNKLAAIEGQLVSIKNVSTHKSACLTIHVPEEYALKVIEAFGWPTMVAPVPVAIAKLDLNAKHELKGGKLCQRAAILCGEKAFWEFIHDEHDILKPQTAEEAAIYLRFECGVDSRRELDHSDEAARKFLDLEASYRAWLTVAA